jgi:hypothetical protein
VVHRTPCQVAVVVSLKDDAYIRHVDAVPRAEGSNEDPDVDSTESAECMARAIHYDRAKIDLKMVVRHSLDEVQKLLAVAIPDAKFVSIIESTQEGVRAGVKSWAGLRIGEFVVYWKQEKDGLHLYSSLTQSTLHSTSWIPFVFGKGSPVALGSYSNSMSRIRQAVR